MELPAIQAAQLVFPESSVVSCYFHYSKVKFNGRRSVTPSPTHYDENDDFKRFVRILVGSAQLPPQQCFDIVSHAMRILPRFDDDYTQENVRAFVAYFDRFWVPKMSIWNQWLNGGPRTTNHVEGWHSQLRYIFTQVHPSLGRFLQIVRSEINSVAVSSEKLLRKMRPIATRSSRSQRADMAVNVARRKFETYLNGLPLDDTPDVQIMMRYALHQAHNCSARSFTTLATHQDDAPEEFDI
ncbi:hypothetical protein L596_021674 [Steinernema carpocapsae]|uniref:MULE transposase domain-containing protein n=1 Tax=Steinernema carpocapsae TaxID=34508 RepID=A0A4U5MJF8_STECR|nr:hypothetical protein L596_021674 [Steinernema carpocapsae]